MIHGYTEIISTWVKLTLGNFAYETLLVYAVKLTLFVTSELLLDLLLIKLHNI